MNNEEQLKVISEKNLRLDVLISKQTEFSRSKVKKIIEMGNVLINGQICENSSKKLSGNEEIIILLPNNTQTFEENLQNLPHESHEFHEDLEIIYQDNDLAIINKKPNLTVHPCPSCTERTLVHQLVKYFPKILEMGTERPGIVHRLDKDTSGLILIALHEQARLILSEAFSQRKIHKTYLALVRGLCEDGESFESIGRHQSHKTKMDIVPLNKGGREASTKWKKIFPSLKLFPQNNKNVPFSLLSLEIATGRTHQIRVHLKHKNFPLLGDQVYGSLETAKLAKRQMLHAHKLEFFHPISAEKMNFTCLPPSDFKQTIKNLSIKELLVKPIIITGKSGSGKSAVLNIFKQKQTPVFNADQIVQKLYQPNQDAWYLLKKRYGDRFIDDDGLINKKALFLAMQNKSLRSEIESMVHPLVYKHLCDFLEEHENNFICNYLSQIEYGADYIFEKCQFMAAEIPLWHETSQNYKLNSTVICVKCDENIRQDRLKNRGWDLDTIALMDSWQWSQEDKAKNSDYIIENTKDIGYLELQVNQILKQIHEAELKKLDRILENYDKAISS